MTPGAAVPEAGPPEASAPEAGTPEAGTPEAGLLTWLADGELLTGHVLTSLAGWGPELEINIALSSMGQDEIGHARRLYGLVADGPAEVERLVYERPCPQFRASPLARTYPPEWECLLARQYLYETADAARAAVLAKAADPAVAGLVTEMSYEETYHLDFWSAWLGSTVRTSAAALDRVQRALDQMWPLAAGSFLPPGPECAAAAAALGLSARALAEAGRRWSGDVRAALADLGLELRAGPADPGLDRLEDMLGEMRYVYRTAPGQW